MTLAPSNVPGRKTDRISPRRRPELPEPLVIARWRKNRKGEVIALTIKTFEGINIVDLRTFYPEAGRSLPGKGFAANVHHLPQLAEAFAEALTRARELDLVDSGDPE